MIVRNKKGQFIKGTDSGQRFKKGHKVIHRSDYGKKTSKRLMGHSVSEKTREKLRLANVGKKYPPRSLESRRKMSEIMKGNKNSLGIKRSDAFKQERRVRMISNNPMHIPGIAKKASNTRIANGWRPTFKYSNTKIEIAIENELNNRGIIFEKQVGICGYIVDFYIPSYRIIVECDGDYWHTRPDSIKRDIEKNAVWSFQGFKIYRFWEHEINKSASDCIDKIVLI